MNQVTLYSDWWCPSELSPEWIASHNWNSMLKKYSWAGSLPVISLTLRPNFAVKVYWSYSQACSDSARRFRPALILTNLLWLYWGLQPIAIKLQWQLRGVGWRPLNTLITYMSAHKLREALDTSHFPSSFLTMSLFPTTWWSSRMGNTSETEGMTWQIHWSQGSRRFGDQNECSFWINLCKLVGYLWVKILHPLCRSMSSSSGHVWQRYANADQFADNTWMQTRWKWLRWCRDWSEFWTRPPVLHLMNVERLP